MRIPGIKIPELGITVGDKTMTDLVKVGAIAAGGYYLYGAAGGAAAASGAGAGAGAGSTASMWGPALAGGALSYLGQSEANQANAGMAQQQMQFQERMSSTAHQREVADLKAAGLNPILSANAGSSTPPGATAQMQSSTGTMVASAIELMRVKQAMEKERGEIALLEAQKNKTNMETRVIRGEVPQSDIKNDLYDLVKPFIHKATESTKQNAREIERAQKIQNTKQYKDFEERMKRLP